MTAINMTPEAVRAVNALCEPGNLDSIIVHLGNAEEALQKAAYENDELSYMYRFAYELKLLREEFERLEKILGYEPDRDYQRSRQQRGEVRAAAARQLLHIPHEPATGGIYPGE